MMRRSDPLDAADHRRFAEDAAPDFAPNLTREELAYVLLAAVCIAVSLGLVVALCFSTLPIPVKP